MSDRYPRDIVKFETVALDKEKSTNPHIYGIKREGENSTFIASSFVYEDECKAYAEYKNVMLHEYDTTDFSKYKYYTESEVSALLDEQIKSTALVTGTFIGKNMPLDPSELDKFSEGLNDVLNKSKIKL